MITTQLHSGIGNQMFMIAAVIGLGVKWHEKPLFPSQIIETYRKDKYFNNLPEMTAKNKIQNIYIEKGHQYQNIPFKPNMEIKGYFQSEKYFLHAKAEVIEVFSKDLDLKQPSINKTSIHIRRGDYLKDTASFPIVPGKYYYQQIDNNKQYLCFSDDIQYCKLMFKDYSNIEYSENRTCEDDLILMSRCEHNIIANSTFSWWAAWLNKNPDKVVTAPNQWFGSKLKHLDVSDIIPENWIKI